MAITCNRQHFHGQLSPNYSKSICPTNTNTDSSALWLEWDSDFFFKFFHSAYLLGGWEDKFLLRAGNHLFLPSSKKSNVSVKDNCVKFIKLTLDL